jgi:hypothetical protein
MKKYIKKFFAKIGNAMSDAIVKQNNVYIQSIVDNDIQKIYDNKKYEEPGRLLRSGFKVWSQNDEDGIIQEILNRIDTKNKYFVEIGVGDGLENNTLFLLVKGWKGLWIEGSSKNCNFIEKKFNTLINKGFLKIDNVSINVNNINHLLMGNSVPEEIDLLSIDIDGNDYHIFKALNATSPRVVVIEYNAKFPPPVLWVMRYNPGHVWDLSDYFGASLKSFERLFAARGYSLVGCSITGANAFFVRNDLVGDKFCQPFTAENHYEPPRYWLTQGFISGRIANFGEFESI